MVRKRQRQKGSRKRSAETLAQVIQGLEQGTTKGARSAVLALLSGGPLFCSDALLNEITEDGRPLGNDELALIGAELTAFLRAVVREQAQGRFSGALSVYRPVTFAANLAGTEVACAVDGPTRELAVLQLIMLLERVEMKSVRVCPGCPRLFVKTYRRKFCSVRCQKRIYAREHSEEGRL